MQPGREERTNPWSIGDIGILDNNQLADGSGIRNDKQPNIRHAFGGPLYRWSFASAAVFPDQEVRWLYESNKLQASSNKLLDISSGII